MRNRFRRRDFMRIGAAGMGLAPLAGLRDAQAAQQRVALIVDPADPIATAPPALWALSELRAALEAKGASVRQLERVEQARRGETCVLACSAYGPIAAAALANANASIGEGPERLALLSTRVSHRDVRLACANDARGLMYVLNELTDRLDTGAPLGEALALPAPIIDQPGVPVRSIMRQFVSKTLDRTWFEDREMWPHYLAMLAKQRFNRLHLGFGLGYDSLHGVTDSYLLFLYPFLVDVPGYQVSVSNYSAVERAANLETLRYISEQAVAHGLDFQLGIWTHGYELIDSAGANHQITGLTPETHAAYCRDALAELLRACPAISSVCIRFHGESGIAEGSYDFWQTVYDGVRACGRVVEIDLHAKGIDQSMLDRAMSTGMPVNVSEKCWAEHHGMPYHQADIRPGERPRQNQIGAGLMTLSEGALSFTRYGYADLLREDRRYTVRHRVFAGTQKLLAGGDPAWAATYAKRFTFCGTQGFDLMEPLTYRGRRGTGIEGARRSGYADAELEPRWDWEKYLYWYRIWGRLTYNPNSDPSVWRRHFSASDSALVSALARASRILPIVTCAYMPSAACDAYWPEIYWNQPLAAAPSPNPYFDTTAPFTFQFAPPHDPQLFSNADECAGELLAGRSSGKYSPLEVAHWLDALAASVEADLAAVGAPNTIDKRRLVIDTRIVAGLGRFFAHKFRAGVAFAIHERSNDRAALDAALVSYRAARSAWAELSEHAGVYAQDLSVSDRLSERAHWRGHLPLIDADIAALEARRSAAVTDAGAAPALRAALAAPRARQTPCRHNPPANYRPNADLTLESAIAPGRTIASLACLYRHVNQAERWREIPMTEEGGVYRAVIPAAYAGGAYPLQYYFVARESPIEADLCPGFGPDLSDEPYFVVRRA